MKLEVISHLPVGRAHPTPLLFVHGAYSGAWVWDQHFLPYFAKQGYQRMHCRCAATVRVKGAMA